MKGETESKSVCQRERERGPLEVDLNPALQCRVSLLLDKVIRHQKVLFLYLFCPQSGFKAIDPEATQTFVVKSLIQHWTALILFVKQVIHADSFRSLTHAVFALGVHLGEAQVADWSEGICWMDHCLRCITAHTHTQLTAATCWKRCNWVLIQINSCKFILLYSHNYLLFEEGAIKGEGFIFTSFSTNMNSILLGELISKQNSSLKYFEIYLPLNFHNFT